MRPQMKGIRKFQNVGVSSVDLYGAEEPGPHDVLFGRGTGSNMHPGNIRFRALIQKYKKIYRDTPKKMKPSVSTKVVSLWRDQDPPGRFLIQAERFHGSRRRWQDVGDAAARRKAAQCLREKSSKERLDDSIQLRKTATATTSTSASNSSASNIVEEDRGGSTVEDALGVSLFHEDEVEMVLPSLCGAQDSQDLLSVCSSIHEVQERDEERGDIFADPNDHSPSTSRGLTEGEPVPVLKNIVSVNSDMLSGWSGDNTKTIATNELLNNESNQNRNDQLIAPERLRFESRNESFKAGQTSSVGISCLFPSLMKNVAQPYKETWLTSDPVKNNNDLLCLTDVLSAGQTNEKKCRYAPFSFSGFDLEDAFGGHAVNDGGDDGELCFPSLNGGTFTPVDGVPAAAGASIFDEQTHSRPGKQPVKKNGDTLYKIGHSIPTAASLTFNLFDDM